MKIEEFIAVTVNVPIESADKVRAAIEKAGGGILGKYRACSFTLRGNGRSRPATGSDPHYGSINSLTTFEEEKIETFCTSDKLEKIINAIFVSHPYEEPAITYFPVNIVKK